MNKKVIDVAYTPEEMDFLIKGIPKPGVENTLDWLPDTAWNMVQALSQLPKIWKRMLQQDSKTGITN